MKIFTPEIIYVKILKNQIDFWNVTTNERKLLSHNKPFSSNRLAIANFQIVEYLLYGAVGYTRFKYFLKPTPTIIMHQCYLMDDLCDVEERILREVAISARAREVFVWKGPELTIEDINNKIYRN